MIILWLFLLLLCAWGISYSRYNDHERYLSKNQTNSIKGIFILIVFLSHVNGYIRKNGYAYDAWGDGVFSLILSIIGQLMVVMFLFYSGYGVMESISRKGKQYVKSLPKHRILNTLINFDVAVCIFLVMDFLVGYDVSMIQFLLSLIAWDSLGNSNWYIFAILICYLITWVVGLQARKNQLPQIVWCVFMLITVSVFILFFVKESWWYNTLWAYPVGMMYSTYKENLERYTNEHYASILVMLAVLFVACYKIPFDPLGLKNNVVSVLFAFLIVIFTMRVKIGNPILRWCGENLFPLYIYQRLPMIVFAAILPSWMLSQQPLIYISFCILGTIAAPFLYKFIRLRF